MRGGRAERCAFCLDAAVIVLDTRWLLFLCGPDVEWRHYGAHPIAASLIKDGNFYSSRTTSNKILTLPSYYISPEVFWPKGLNCLALFASING